MLFKLLEVMKQNKPLSLENAAEKLGTTPAVVKLMLDQLVALGYVEKVSDSDCRTSCTSGSGCAGCIDLQRIFWTVSNRAEKSSAMAQKIS